MKQERTEMEILLELDELLSNITEEDLEKATPEELAKFILLTDKIKNRISNDGK